MKDLVSRIIKLLQPRERKQGIRVSLAVFVNALLDFVGLASLLPILYYLLEGGTNKIAALQFCLLAIVICLVKYLVSTRLSIYQNTFLLELYKRLSFSLYSSYFAQGLLFIRKQGISRLGYEINVICYAFSQSILAPLLKMAGDGLLIILVLLALVVYSPVTALILFLSFIPFVLVYLLLIRKRVKQCGELESEARRTQARVVNDSFGGYAELQVNDAFSLYSKQFQSGMDTIARSRLKMNKVQRLPLFLSELAVVAGLTILCVSGEGDVSVMIGIFAVAAFRLLPAMRSILSAWTVIQNAEYCLDIIEKGLVNETEHTDEELEFRDSISFENLTYSYPDGGEVFRDFSLKISKGEYIGFRGDSGAGKSTLFNLLLGFISPDSGRILIDNTLLSAATCRSWRRKIGYVPQDVFVFNSTLAENIAMNSAVDEAKIMRILDSLNMREWFEGLPDGLNTLLSERGEQLSGGQRQRIGIARAIYRDVEVLLLDEASSSLDNDTEKDLLDNISRLRQKEPMLTILSIAHRDSSLANCERIIQVK